MKKKSLMIQVLTLIFLIVCCNVVYCEENLPAFLEESPHLNQSLEESSKLNQYLKEYDKSEINKEFENKITKFLQEIEKQKTYQKGVKEAQKVAKDLNTYYDYDKVAKQAEQEGNSTLEKQNKDNTNIKKTYYLILSSSIPKETLRNYAYDIKKYRKQGIEIVPILRGFINGVKLIKPTVDWYISWAKEKLDQPLSEDNGLIVDITINPLVVKDVNLVPALLDKDSDCYVIGDAPIRTLIEAIQDYRCKEKLGQTYQFAEKNALEQIQEHLKKQQWLAKQEEIKQKLKDKLYTKYSNFYCMSLPKVKEDKKYLVTPFYTLDFDIPDPRQENVILYPKGYTFNPLQYSTFTGSIIVLNGNNKQELDNLDVLIDKAEKPVRILLTEGNYIDISKKIKKYQDKFEDVFVYAHCKSLKTLIEKYGLCVNGTPCIITQQGTQFSVLEKKIVEKN